MSNSSEIFSDVTLQELSPAMQDAVARAAWTDLMPVQSRTIPYLLAKRDVMIQARTGSGKTGAYLLPLLEILQVSKQQCQALIMVPTRELARQVSQEADLLCGPAGLRTAAVYGGVGYGPQIEALKRGSHIVVGTPGRVLDHLLRGTLTLDSLAMLIFDEADRMLSMGFYPDMIKIQSYMPARKVPSSLFSATFPSFVMATAGEFLHDPQFISLSEGQVHVADTEHIVYTVAGMDKDRSLVRIIEIENPASALIFCNTKAEVHYVTVVLQQFGYDADELTSDLPQSAREHVLMRLRKGALRFLVATDVAARGIDIPELSHVILYEPPDESEAYIHRAGRTGRAGASGIAISLVNTVEKFTLDRIGKRFGIDLHERPVPTDEDVQTVVAERVIALLEARLREREKRLVERSLRFVPLGRALAENEDESAIIAMLLDDFYQKSLHAPAFVLPEIEQESPSDKSRTSRNRSSRRKRPTQRRRN